MDRREFVKTLSVTAASLAVSYPAVAMGLAGEEKREQLGEIAHKDLLDIGKQFIKTLHTMLGWRFPIREYAGPLRDELFEQIHVSWGAVLGPIDIYAARQAADITSFQYRKNMSKLGHVVRTRTAPPLSPEFGSSINVRYKGLVARIARVYSPEDEEEFYRIDTVFV